MTNKTNKINKFLSKYFDDVLCGFTIVSLALIFALIGGAFNHLTEQAENLQSLMDCETVTAYVTDINSQDNCVTVQDTNGETWHFDNQKAEYNSVFTITYRPSDWELLDYSVK